MFKILLIKEIQHYLYGLRFHVSFAMVMLTFVIGTLSFVPSFRQANENHLRYATEQHDALERNSKNATVAAVSLSTFALSPKGNAIISDCSGQHLPDKIVYSAFNVFEFKVSHNNLNPLMKTGRELNWAFIVSVVLSFVTLLFAYDAISGEKEDRTISLMFSNAVPRGVVLLSKLSGIVLVVMSMALAGIIASLLILVFSSCVQLSGVFLAEVGAFLGITFFLITLMAVCGLLASVLSSSSNISLLISLCVWLLFVVVVPNTAVFWANTVFPIPHADEVQMAIRQGRKSLNDNAPQGSWSSNDGNPFWDRHKLRADLQTKLLANEKQHRDAYYALMFSQFDNTRRITLFSPIAQFDYMNEAILGGGYLRFRKNWDDLHLFQSGFFNWFRDLDAKDEKSPHWFNPYESLSTTRQEVEVSQIPVYTEQKAGWGERFSAIVLYLSVMLIYTTVLFGVVVYRFQHYDVR
ncbi:MAG TPA: hypothetical protein DCR43_01420 [Bacteroidales bacterium]|nr:MAG: hypothetical protein A2X11_13995 [Bacteroidetes bacterium GWE2_42_24]OFY28294.1 MAG: hypothetical protein A2X09_16145 [Bacteroidetes bacterium GWF2_43_11]HAQ64510.1 hypothetical protein [Bacteroidales bacterium]HBZ66208.1 hypothetical protein [Bacteroidales bacterium]